MLSRLTINISHICNLNCVYCYADGGAYGGASVKMDSASAAHAIAEAVKRHNRIGMIQFFGGEPLTNAALIKEVVWYVNRHVQHGSLLNTPKFSVVTNLTLLEEDDVAFFEENGFIVVVSLDGDRTIHDELRPTRGGKGTYEVVVSNIDRLSKGKVSYSIEATYTKLHKLRGISILQLVKKLTLLGPERVDVVIVGGKGNEDVYFSKLSDLTTVYNDFLDAFIFCVRSVGNGEIIPFGPMIDMMGIFDKRHNADLFCPAGSTNLAIDVNGDFYPCHMLVNKSEHRIRRSNVSVNMELRTPKIFIKSFPECADCWARKWCSVCVAKSMLLSPNDEGYFNAHCKLNKDVISFALQEIPRNIHKFIEMKS